MAVLRVNMFSNAMGMSTSVTIVLPSFDQETDFGKSFRTVYPLEKKYPVLWLLHGGSGDDADYLNWTNVARFSVQYDCAVICPSNYNTAYNDYPRGGKYYEFITKELRAFCVANFPISDRREDNFIGGLSMGSGGAMKIAVTECERYSHALIMSGGIGPKNQLGAGHSAFRDRLIAIDWPMPKQPKDVIRDDIEALLRQDVADGRPVPKFIMACGDADNIAWEAHVNGVKIMQELGLDPIDFWLPDYRHEWDFWEICMRKAFSEWLPLKRKEASDISDVWTAPVPGKE